MEDQVTKNEPSTIKNQLSGTTEVGTTIGVFLKEERQKKNLSLKQISQKTKINMTQLEYLEEDKLDLLPNKAYVVGYLKSYSKVLGIEPHIPMSHLDITYSILNPSKGTDLKKDQIVAEEIDKKPYMIIGALITIIFVLVVVYALKTNPVKETDPSSVTTEVNQNQSSNANEPAVADSTLNETPPAQLTETTPVVAAPNTNTEIQKITFPKEEPAQNNNDQTLKPVKQTQVEEKKNEEIKAEDKKDEPAFAPMQKKLYAFATNPPEETLKYLPSDIKNNVVPGKQNVFIYAHKGDSWLTYQVDDKDPRQSILTQNSSINLVGSIIKVFFGNVNATTVFLNGKLININTRTGVRNLIFPEEKSSQFVFPLFIFNKQTGEVITSEEYLREKNAKKN
ncbi:MAG: hypothetical protein A2381_03495 [Bdellovibrionales bacterium RIFOXYB1_FULL_37_110]|nr:MAG: hypothetical protein A2181_06230 [Bdellovibrionales bacterium RIFOXYA1_FULL_38_20]OFZ48470.1 MAG: hypothetical protein A2417_03985 [Bdellovibrionales bacterium RIFOXYC1_FULL_37_79]OFZ55776.1 MAG: hypothetical protein A2328_05635 [Bdellovibrionales bacterium RIFOXYB2_FULL_36_6]OFZ57991.1 MAG: hypothetical protein A2381_03495 [Bdellovibrionales bacterium RIFOXYB1_FULL_37_110]OFZ63128.1 MAG: hypothetical protein A2577_15625 [Bdellovibrionales bacterium RIFOXYD1_FULL_36_51]